jgi:predicted Zn-dependent protease with MMP-like domain
MIYPPGRKRNDPERALANPMEMGRCAISARLKPRTTLSHSGMTNSGKPVGNCINAGIVEKYILREGVSDKNGFPPTTRGNDRALKMEKERFEELVAEAIDELPEYFRETMKNVYVVVEDFPSPEVMKGQKLRSRLNLLGLYQGIPLKKRGIYYSNALPDRITIYQKPVESLCRNDETEIKKEIGEVLRHEIGHHFGFEEKELAEI